MLKRQWLLGVTILEMCFVVLLISALLSGTVYYYKQVAAYNLAKALRNDIIQTRNTFIIAGRMNTVNLSWYMPTLPPLSLPITSAGYASGITDKWVFNKPQGAMWTMGINVSDYVCKLATADLKASGFVGQAPWWIPGQASCSMQIY
jgi:hypothetical protein